MSTIDLQPFCAVADIRHYLLRPFVIDGHKFAANGLVIVRVPCGEPDTEDLTDSLYGAVRRMFSESFDGFEPLPTIPTAEVCPDCSGTGRRSEADCPDCHNGYFEHGDHEYECKECDGTGRVTDVECANRNCLDGTLRSTLKIGDALFDTKHLRKIAALPNARIAVQSQYGPAAFQFDGGEGRLMPCRE